MIGNFHNQKGIAISEHCSYIANIFNKWDLLFQLYCRMPSDLRSISIALLNLFNVSIWFFYNNRTISFFLFFRISHLHDGNPLTLLPRKQSSHGHHMNTEHRRYTVDNTSSPVLVIRSRMQSHQVKTQVEQSKQANDDLFQLWHIDGIVLVLLQIELSHLMWTLNTSGWFYRCTQQWIVELQGQILWSLATVFKLLAHIWSWLKVYMFSDICKLWQPVKSVYW